MLVEFYGRRQFVCHIRTYVRACATVLARTHAGEASLGDSHQWPMRCSAAGRGSVAGNATLAFRFPTQGEDGPGAVRLCMATTLLAAAAPA